MTGQMILLERHWYGLDVTSEHAHSVDTYVTPFFITAIKPLKTGGRLTPDHRDRRIPFPKSDLNHPYHRRHVKAVNLSCGHREEDSRIDRPCRVRLRRHVLASIALRNATVTLAARAVLRMGRETGT